MESVTVHTQKKVEFVMKKSLFSRVSTKLFISLPFCCYYIYMIIIILLYIMMFDIIITYYYFLKVPKTMNKL